MKRPMPWLMYVTDPGDGGGSAPPNPDGDDGAGKTFTQEEVNALVGQARTEERRKVSSRFADYDDLKARAEGAKTVEDRMADLERQLTDANAAAMRLRVAGEHGISTKRGPNGEPSDADLFLTGADEDTLVAQAQRLAQREADRKKQGNVAPREGNNPTPGTGDKDGLRDFTRNLFASVAAED